MSTKLTNKYVPLAYALWRRASAVAQTRGVSVSVLVSQALEALLDAPIKEARP